MLAEAIYEQPSVSWDSLLEAFFILESFLNVAEPTRPAELVPSLWIGSFSGTEGMDGAVYKLANPQNPNPRPDQQYAIAWVNGNKLDINAATYFDPKELDIESLAASEPNHMNPIAAARHDTEMPLSIEDRTWLQETLEHQKQKKQIPKRSASARPS